METNNLSIHSGDSEFFKFRLPKFKIEAIFNYTVSSYQIINYMFSSRL